MAYFEGWQDDLARVKMLMADSKYYLEAILVLSCYIGALGSLRYPGEKEDNKAYKRVVREYSGKKDFYEQIDLLFFLQWPRSQFQSHKGYLKLKNHEEISKAIVDAYGDEVQIKNGIRYISQQDFLTCVEQRPFPRFDGRNLREHLPRFSLCEMLYRYLRCRAVHGVRFPLVDKPHQVGGGIRYEDNHAITRAVLLETTENILTNMRLECLEKAKWPEEL
ncbi:MAG: hypothetical protein OEV99_00160 [Nitrospira sp.]|nr:hypothetical protein [Nitrospira sp.]MDH4368225.1 hypothetical protein [Nitrospira sp.]MDH5348425.1 hypothetical protein [Nitrospira sp.]MDH5495867.1 hypothetical protein [Nitrospira sp.]MDH5725542.1 hypothetical protein [Nitrospira sp.]